VGTLVSERGVNFQVTPQTAAELIQAGADQELLQLLRNLAPAKPPEPPPPSPPVLVINGKPGEAEVYVDDERRGRSSPAGTLKVTGLAPGQHRVRLSAEGYHSSEVSVELVAGETNTVVVALQPMEPTPLPPKEPTSTGTPGNSAGAGSTGSPGPAPTRTPADPNDPASPHEPGIYLLQKNGPVGRMVRLEPAAVSTPRAKSSKSAWSGMLGVSGGSSDIKWTYSVAGPSAQLRVSERDPVFYFYFRTDNTLGAANGVFLTASSPTEFVVVRLQGSKHERVVPADVARNALSFDQQRMGPGIYKVQLRGEIKPGEYGFIYNGGINSMTGTRVFDFGIDKAK
jgi:hypothetical protein